MWQKAYTASNPNGSIGHTRVLGFSLRLGKEGIADASTKLTKKWTDHLEYYNNEALVRVGIRANHWSEATDDVGKNFCWRQQPPR